MTDRNTYDTGGDAGRMRMAVRLDQLAERLGVVPWTEDRGPSWLIRFGTNTYDVFDMINAVLDKLEERKME